MRTSPELPDYRYAQLAEALNSFGYQMDDHHYKLSDFSIPSPDKTFYFFTDDHKAGEVLAFLTEDYISDLAYVKDCFSNELNAELIKLHKPGTTAAHGDADYEVYGVPFASIYTGFLATIKPHDLDDFWKNIKKNLEAFWLEAERQINEQRSARQP